MYERFRYMSERCSLGAYICTTFLHFEYLFYHQIIDYLLEEKIYV